METAASRVVVTVVATAAAEVEEAERAEAAMAVAAAAAKAAIVGAATAVAVPEAVVREARAERVAAERAAAEVTGRGCQSGCEGARWWRSGSSCCRPNWCGCLCSRAALRPCRSSGPHTTPDSGRQPGNQSSAATKAGRRR